MPLILPGNVGSATAATGFNVANSLRFNSGSSDRLNKTLGTPTNNLKWTYSFWIKRSKLGEEVAITEALNDSQNKGIILFRSDDKLEILDLISDSYVMQKKTNRVFRDTASWYHIVFSNDSTAGSPDLKIYVNGVEETSFATDNEYSQNQAGSFNSALANHIGASASSRFSNCYFSQFVFIDGLALAADQFGEFDSDSGIWKPIDVSGLTFGDNGFFLKFEESGTGTDANGMGADSSGNTNHFAVNNLTAVDQSTDTCTNNFATLNPLGGSLPLATFSDGNLTLASNTASAYQSAIGTIAIPTTGNWYWEYKVLQTTNGSSGEGFIGVALESSYNASSNPQKLDADGIIAELSGASGGSNFDAGDIASVEVDRTNNTLKIFKNGSSTASLTKTSLPNEIIFPYVTCFGSGTASVSANFGSPSFAISSGNTDGNGYGNFEYAVPSGYLSLCTANLSEVLG